MRRKFWLLLLVPLVLLLTGCPFLNKLPIWESIPDLVRELGDTVSISLSAYCSDPDGDPLTFELVSGPGSITGSTYNWTVTAPTGARTVNLSASDGKGYVYTSFTITVKSPPNTPSNPSPADAATNQNYPNLSLSWTGGDPDGDAVVYDLYFGTVPNPPLYASNVTTTNYGKSGLKNFSKYYWRIVAKDGTNTVAGPVWSFMTKAYELVNENFESRPAGTLSAHTLPWANYMATSPAYAYISTSQGYGNSKGLTFVDQTESGTVRVERTGLTPIKRGSVQFKFRVAPNAVFGFRNNVAWVPYVAVSDMGSGYGLYSYNGSTGVFTKMMNIAANTWYTLYIYFDFNAGENYYHVYVDSVFKRTESLGATAYSLTAFAFIAFSDTIANWVDIDDVIIRVLESNYTTSAESDFVGVSDFDDTSLR